MLVLRAIIFGYVMHELLCVAMRNLGGGGLL